MHIKNNLSGAGFGRGNILNDECFRRAEFLAQNCLHFFPPFKPARAPAYSRKICPHHTQSPSHMQSMGNEKKNI
jgi:hypothetical protein